MCIKVSLADYQEQILTPALQNISVKMHNGTWTYNGRAVSFQLTLENIQRKVLVEPWLMATEKIVKLLLPNCANLQVTLQQIDEKIENLWQFDNDIGSLNCDDLRKQIEDLFGAYFCDIEYNQASRYIQLFTWPVIESLAHLQQYIDHELFVPIHNFIRNRVTSISDRAQSRLRLCDAQRWIPQYDQDMWNNSPLIQDIQRRNPSPEQIISVREHLRSIKQFMGDFL